MASTGEAEISKEDTERFHKLFDKLDVNKDGKVEVSELTSALKSMKGVADEKISKQYAKEIMQKADENENLELDFAEFSHYMQKHERQLRLAFSDLDRNKDGKIEASEVAAALKKLGLNVTLDEAKKLTEKIDKDGSLSVDWREWREFFQLAPSGDLEAMMLYWRQSLMIDIGELISVPPEFTKKEKASGMWWRYLVAGATAGAISRTATAPLDRVKITLQVHGSDMSIAQCLKKMIEEGGVKSLWRGNGTNVIKIAPESAMRFAAYEQIKKWMVPEGTEVTVGQRFLSGASAGAFAQSTIYPLEVIKTRLAVMKTGQYKGILDCGLKVAQREGFMALYKGYIPNLIGIIPYAGIDLSIYETLKNLYMKRNPEKKDPGVLTLLACGTMSSTCGQIASYPLALIRTRLQAAASPEAKAGFVTLAKSIAKREGLRGFYRGIAPNFMKVLPAVSISYVIYERAKVALGINNK